MHILEKTAVTDVYPMGLQEQDANSVRSLSSLRQPTNAAVVSPIDRLPATPMDHTTAVATPAVTELFGSFFLAEDEFALPAIAIREVVNFPEKLIPIPLSPHFLEGVFTLRGNVIPVINLNRIFNPEAARAEASHKIAIVDHDDIQVGLLFHATGEILRVRPEQRARLQYPDPATFGVVSGTIRLNDGIRLLQVLDPSALISIDNVPQILAMKSTGKQVETNHFHLQAERRQCVAFKVGSNTFAFEMNAIREIIDVPELKNSVLHSKLCIGRINLRGTTVAVVDFARMLNVEPQSDACAPTDAKQSSAKDGEHSCDDAELMPERRIIIARIGDASIGLLVDSVDNILSYFPGDILPIPLFSKTRSGMFGGCLQKEGIGTILYLDHEQIFSSTEVIDLTRGHQELYEQPRSADQAIGKLKGDTQRQVYITFAIGHVYALEITKIREIIDIPQDILKPPGMPDFVEGILNLRRQMVTIVNMRSLYQMPPQANAGMGKILIIDRGEDRFGLMVDSVENILTVANTDRIRAPRIAEGKAVHDVRNEMQEVLQVGAADSVHQTISVFNIDTFQARLSHSMAPLETHQG